jgi:DNA segregation ATPase FtsK/SpoIIIE, S-DNA-T family
VARRRQVHRKANHSSISLTKWIGGVCALLALVCAAALVIPDFPFKLLLRMMFGLGAYLLPLLLAFLALSLFWGHFDKTYRFHWPAAIGWVMLFVVGLASLQLPLPERAVTVDGGGNTGQWLVDRLGGGSALSILVLLVGAVIALILAMRVSVAQLQRAATTMGRGIWWSILGLIAFGRRTASGRVVHGKYDPGWDVEAPPASPAPPVTNRTDGPPPVRKPTPVRPATSPPVKMTQAPLPGGRWSLPGLDLLDAPAQGNEPSESDLQSSAAVIKETLADFGILARVVEIRPGPTLTQFGIDPGFRERRDRWGGIAHRERVKVRDVVSLRDDLAIALAAKSLRIEAPVPGRNVIGIEVPNPESSVVCLRSVMDTEAYHRLVERSKLAFALGLNVSGTPMGGDLTSMPHLLIAGSTNSGKSVCINAMITGLLMQNTPDDLRLLLVDPKRVELVGFNDIPHLLRRVVVDTDRVVGVLTWLIDEMDRRYRQFEITGCRNISDFNRRATANPNAIGQKLPYIVLIIDELADLMMLAAEDVEKLLCRLAQLARATGIHLVVATQRPSVDVVTGLIKANFPARISFAMKSQIDSRTVLDTAGAEKLLGRGDMLYAPTDAAQPMRIQGCFVSDREIERVVRFWKAQGQAQYVEELEQAPSYSDIQSEAKKDDLYEDAIAQARQHRTISVSLLQRRLGIGYARAARLIDKLEEDGIVGPAQGSRSREVLVRDEDDPEESEAIDEA